MFGRQRLFSILNKRSGNYTAASKRSRFNVLVQQQCLIMTKTENTVNFKCLQSFQSNTCVGRSFSSLLEAAETKANAELVMNN